MSFLNYTGKVNKIANQYFYEMRNKKNRIKTSCMTKVGNPIIDNLFKYIFLEDKKTLKNLLNSLLFTGDEEIKELEFIPNDLPSLTGEKYGKNAKKIDVGAKCQIGQKVKKKKYVRLINNIVDNYTMIIDLEMQIGLKEEDTKRFIDYATALYSRYKTDKVWIVALTFSSIKKSLYQTNKSSKTLFCKKSFPKSAEIKTYDNITILQIDLNFCYELMEHKKNIWILDPDNCLDISGEEWIKYLTIPLWCHLEDGFYLFPDISVKGFFKEAYVRDSLLKLSNFNNEAFQNYEKDSILFEKEKSLLELENSLNKREESLLEKEKSLMIEKEGIKDLKEKCLKLEKENERLRKNRIIIEPPKIEQFRRNKNNFIYPKKNRKKIIYPKKSDDKEEENEESKDSDYYPYKSDEENDEEDKDSEYDMDLDSN